MYFPGLQSLKFYGHLIWIAAFFCFHHGDFHYCFVLKSKQSIILPAIFFSGIAEELQFRTCKLWQTIGKSEEQRQRALFS